MPKIVDHHRYRQELLERCLTLFAERGFSTITMRQIAASLGVSTGTLYHYFPNKESIFVQLVQEYCEKDVAEFFAQVPLGEDLTTKLRRVMTFFLENYAAYQRQFLIWVDFYQYCQHGGSQETAALEQFWQRTHEKLAAYLQLPATQVDCLLTLMDGLLLQCLYNHDEAAVARQMEVFIGLFEHQKSG